MGRFEFVLFDTVIKLLSLIYGFICLTVYANADTGKRCISDCEGRANGDYQSCLGCDVYASCSEGIFTDNRPCPDEGTVWDDKLKKCLFNSNTCKSKRQLASRSTGSRCITDCIGRPNGDYQSCLGCKVYASCSE